MEWLRNTYSANATNIIAAYRKSRPGHEIITGAPKPGNGETVESLRAKDMVGVYDNGEQLTVADDTDTDLPPAA